MGSSTGGSSALQEMGRGAQMVTGTSGDRSMEGCAASPGGFDLPQAL